MPCEELPMFGLLYILMEVFYPSLPAASDDKRAMFGVENIVFYRYKILIDMEDFFFSLTDHAYVYYIETSCISTL